MLDHKGFKPWQRSKLASAKGQMPTDELVDGVMILVGGVLLLTPGYFTDIFGFILMIPLSRNALKSSVRNWFQKQMQSGRVHVQYYSNQGGGFHGYNQPQRPQDPNVLDVTPISDRSDRNKKRPAIFAGLFTFNHSRSRFCKLDRLHIVAAQAYYQ